MTENLNLPEQVLALKKLEEKNFQKQEFVEPEIVSAKSPKSSKGIFRNYKKIILAVIATIIFLIACLVLSAFTNFDSQVFKMEYEITVIDSESSEPIEGAKIIFDSQEFYTNNQGQVTINGKDVGKYQIAISAEGYNEFSSEVQLSGSFMNYTNKRTYTLSKGTGISISGKFVGQKDGYDFSNDKISIQDQLYNINKDGSFVIENINRGVQVLELKSANFVDHKIELFITQEKNQVEDIQLIPAGDIVAEIRSHVTQKVIDGIDIQVENVAQDMIEIDSESATLRVKDLEIGKEYTMRTSADGYITGDYQVTIEQGENILFDFRLVEEGKAIFPLKKDEARFSSLYVSDYDGENLTKLTDITNLDPYNIHFDPQSNLIYFQTKESRIGDTFNDRAGLVKVYDFAQGSVVDALGTVSKTSMGNIYPSYKSKRMLITRLEDKKVVSYISDLTGENRKKLFESEQDAKFINTYLSDDGSKALLSYKVGDSHTLLSIDTQSGDTLEISNRNEAIIQDMTVDSSKVIYLATDTETEQKSLYQFDFANQEGRELIRNTIGSNFEFLDDDTIIFIDNVSNRSNIHTYTISENSRNLLTNMNSGDVINNFDLFEDKVLYFTEDSIFIMDIDSPVSYRKVVDI